MPGFASNPLLLYYQTHYSGLLRFLTRRTRCADAAQDLMQDTWLCLAEKDGTAFVREQEQDLRAYIYTVAANLEIDRYRKADRTAQRFVAIEDPAHLESLASTPDVSTAFLARDTLRHVDAVLAQLPQRTREVFLASRLEGARRAELAERFGISLKTVERDITTAMTQLEQALHAQRGERPPAATGKARRKNLARLLSLSGGLLALPAAWRGWRHFVPVWQGEWHTASAGFHGQVLPDGSTVLLDSLSAIAVTYYASRRVALLHQGAAFFQVARDADRPFTVHALDARITVLGTGFGVDVGAGQLRVEVESGHVRVEAADGSRRELGAGESVTVRQHGGFMGDVVHGEPGQAAPWRSGWLHFDDIPLAQAVQRLSRYTHDAVEVAPDAAALRVYGRVNIANRQAWLQQLPSILPVRLVPAPGGGLRIARRS